MAEIQQYQVDEPYLKLDCGLGEAPFWEESRRTLRFVDIVKQKVYLLNVDKGPSSHEVKSLDISIGTTADIEGKDDEFIFGGKHGYGIFDRNAGTYKYINKYWTDEEIADNKPHRMRANDGNVDVEGRFFLGTMNDPLVKSFTDEGYLFRLDPDLNLHRILSGVTIPNGSSWSHDNKKFYWTDSVTGQIDVFDYDRSTGAITKRRPFWKTPIEGTAPDGHAMDEEGYLWVAVFGSWKVFRVSPDAKVVAEIKLPTRCVTCPCFVGEDLYITSAAEEEPDKYPESTKLAGSLFKVTVGVKGVQRNKFKFAPGVSVGRTNSGQQS
ncbi:MAG: hypothetical protein M1820_006683 [Bogoriella megaspora]|nr:MAG: hypothetical protein M1820_006683 [Bogoriella megaspora]